MIGGIWFSVILFFYFFLGSVLGEEIYELCLNNTSGCGRFVLRC